MMNRPSPCLAVLALLLLVLPACYSVTSKGESNHSFTMVETNTHNWHIQFGDQGGKLEYIAFSGEKKPKKPTGMVITHSSEEDTILECDEITMKVADYQLFESVDGKFRKSKGDVIHDEIKAFIKSKPDSYTIDALLTFVKKRRSDR